MHGPTLKRFRITHMLLLMLQGARPEPMPMKWLAECDKRLRKISARFLPVLRFHEHLLRTNSKHSESLLRPLEYESSHMA